MRTPLLRNCDHRPSRTSIRPLVGRQGRQGHRHAAAALLSCSKHSHRLTSAGQPVQMSPGSHRRRKSLLLWLPRSISNKTVSLYLSSMLQRRSPLLLKRRWMSSLRSMSLKERLNQMLSLKRPIKLGSSRWKLNGLGRLMAKRIRWLSHRKMERVKREMKAKRMELEKSRNNLKEL